MVHQWVQERGFGFFAADGYRSLTLTCVKNNRRVESAHGSHACASGHQMAIDGGYGKIKGGNVSSFPTWETKPKDRCGPLLEALDDSLEE